MGRDTEWQGRFLNKFFGDTIASGVFGEDVREALAEKLRSDFNLFISAHELKNLAWLERHCRGRESYKARAEEALGRIFEDTLQNIEAMHVSLRSRRHFAE